MSSGRVHATVAWSLAVPLAGIGGYAYATGNPALCIGVWCGTVAGILITPDADLEGTTWEEARFYSLAKPVGLLWQWAWFLYARAIPHRGISHTPILGTLTRVTYAAFLSHLLTWLVNGAWLNYCQLSHCTPGQIAIPYWEIAPQTALGTILAWSIQDLGHILFDRKRTSRKRQPRKRQPRIWPILLAAIAVFFLKIR
ncbi:MAG TPA: DUF2227 family putative metal-binding protein [Anaerolineae bacterium]|nr:DUF2227 family putative metal-binding protein [Anaerolineae bacterium]